MAGSDPEAVFRSFRNSRYDLAEKAPGVFRLSSALFKTADLSVDDGSICAIEETATREGDRRGVASLNKAFIVGELGLKIEPDEDGHHRGHCVIRGAQTRAKRLRKHARIVLEHPDVVVVDDER